MKKNIGFRSQFLPNTLKGLAIGTANVVPGLSGGTVALICGVFERLIYALKSCDAKAMQLFFHRRFTLFARHIDLALLLPLFFGLLLGNFGLARLLGYLFHNYPVYTWAFFFGLVLASIFFVAKQTGKWSFPATGSLLAGILLALAITALPPAAENDASWYLLLCGIIAICSMILPGLSGSYILILLGNYQLIILSGLGELRLNILGPFLLGAILGLLAFSRALSWLLHHYHGQVLAMLTGFIAGSLRSLWPWKQELLQDFGGEQKVIAYRYLTPEIGGELFWALLLAVLGAASILLSEWLARRSKLQ